MALWMTGKEECFGLAALLLVLACAKLADNWGMWKDKYAVPALLVLVGLTIGVARMEWEEFLFEEEQAILAEIEEQADVAGVIEEISETDYGYRLILKHCLVDGKEVRRIYCYLDHAEYLKLGMKISVSGTAEIPERAGNPGQFDFRKYCLAKGIAGIFQGESVDIISSGYLWIREELRCFRLSCSDQIKRIAETSDCGILTAVLLGNKSELDEDIYEVYRVNGIAHILAVSGLHISVIGMGLWRILRMAGWGYFGAGAVAFSCLFVYGTIAGFGASVARAVAMMGISFLAGVFGRTYDLPSAMCVPAMFLLVMHPFLITQASFQLSFLAVEAIFFPGEYLAKCWKWTGRKKDVLISASIQVVTIPVILFHSYEFPPYSIILNLIVIPLMAYVLISGLLALFVSFFYLPAGKHCLGAAHYILELYRNCCVWIQRVPGSNIVFGCPSVLEVIAFYFILVMAICLSVRRKNVWIVMTLAGFLFLAPVPRSGLNVTFLDVGQGDGIYIEESGKNMLVDCGSSLEKNIGEDCLIPFLKYHGVTVIDTVVVSHVDQDHVSGIRYLMEHSDCGISIEHMILPDDGRIDEAENELIRMAKTQGISVSLKKCGDRLDGLLGDKTEIVCLNPISGEGYDRNENSLVMQIEQGDFRMLLTGDAGMEAEKHMIREKNLKPITVLKAGHHGSATSSGQDFLDVVRPQYAVLSYGKGNSYGHPDASVLERLDRVGAAVFETAESGAITVWTDGNKMQITGWFDRQNGI